MELKVTGEVHYHKCKLHGNVHVQTYGTVITVILEFMHQKCTMYKNVPQPQLERR